MLSRGLAKREQFSFLFVPTRAWGFQEEVLGAMKNSALWESALSAFLQKFL
jgi:hypothetical protein